MPELNDAVAAAVARWREYRKPCSLCHGGTANVVGSGELLIEPGSSDTPAKPNIIGFGLILCPTCGGTSYVQPTIVKALIEAVTVPCPCYPGFNYCHDSSCCCDGTGRVPRDWEEIGEGALWGTLVGVADAYPTLTEALEELQSNNDHAGLDEWADWARNSKRPGSAALAAVDEALEQMFGGKSK